MEEEIVNKVASSGLITFNLEDYYPQGERVLIDLKDLLYEGLILREKDFRTYIKEHNWQQYQNKFIAITCSADAVIPTWAYMLLVTALEPFAKKIVYGDLNKLEEQLYLDKLSTLNLEQFKDEKVVIKGCSNIKVPEAAYLEITRLLRPVAKSIMFGEPCSTVPLYKK
jgi:uncharacterized protein DUF2480